LPQYYPNVTVTGSMVINDGTYNGATLVCLANSPITLTFGSTVTADFFCLIVQATANVVTVAAGTGATITNPHSYTGTSGQGSVIGVMAVSDGNMLLVGDGA